MKETPVLKAALAAGGKILSAKFGKVTYKLKRRADLLTEADLAAQAAVIRVINRAFPGDGFMAEESPLKETPNGRMWIIDPLDGTTNYAHGFPAAAVSIAFAEDGVIKAGGVYDPFKKELFLARKGGGATLNGRRLAVSRTAALSAALLVTGFAYDRAEKAEYYCRFFSDFMKISHDVRRMGAASLDLCWLAAGRTDGYWEFNLKPWDVAAGKLIVEEAGGKVTDFRGLPWKGIAEIGAQTLATNGLVHAAMLKIIRAGLRRG
ncbi:MAG TPA: inositol monophosphatase family protein [Elusimicrobiales bacterium]|nr:inositol monophosphatase family protein [Elusimicrobiales bacterium]